MSSFYVIQVFYEVFSQAEDREVRHGVEALYDLDLVIVERQNVDVGKGLQVLDDPYTVEGQI